MLVNETKMCLTIQRRERGVALMEDKVEKMKLRFLEHFMAKGADTDSFNRLVYLRDFEERLIHAKDTLTMLKGLLMEDDGDEQIYKNDNPINRYTITPDGTTIR